MLNVGNTIQLSNSVSNHVYLVKTLLLEGFNGQITSPIYIIYVNP